MFIGDSLIENDYDFTTNDKLLNKHKINLETY